MELSMPQADPQLPDENSRSQRKRDMQALQKLGEALLKLTPGQLEKIALPDHLRDAILHAKTLTANEAKRRQLQYIGKIMRDVDPLPITKALTTIQSSHQKTTVRFHLTEEWRDKLIAQGDTGLNAFMSEYPEADRQQLRQILRKIEHERKTNKDTGGQTALFRYLRSILKETN